MIGTYERLRLHVSASDRDVIRAARRKISKAARRDQRAREARKQFYRAMLERHHAWQEMCRYWRM